MMMAIKQEHLCESSISHHTLKAQIGTIRKLFFLPVQNAPQMLIVHENRIVIFLLASFHQAGRVIQDYYKMAQFKQRFRLLLCDCLIQRQILLAKKRFYLFQGRLVDELFYVFLQAIRVSPLVLIPHISHLLGLKIRLLSLKDDLLIIHLLIYFLQNQDQPSRHVLQTLLFASRLVAMQRVDALEKTPAVIY